MFRKILNEVVTQAAGGPHRAAPNDLFELQPVGRSSRAANLEDHIRPHPRATEPTSGDQYRPRSNHPTQARLPLQTALSPAPQRAEIVRLLRSAHGVRQALVLGEIIGQPRSLREWQE